MALRLGFKAGVPLSEQMAFYQKGGRLPIVRVDVRIILRDGGKQSFSQSFEIPIAARYLKNYNVGRAHGICVWSWLVFSVMQTTTAPVDDDVLHRHESPPHTGG